MSRRLQAFSWFAALALALLPACRCGTTPAAAPVAARPSPAAASAEAARDAAPSPLDAATGAQGAAADAGAALADEYGPDAGAEFRRILLDQTDLARADGGTPDGAAAEAKAAEKQARGARAEPPDAGARQGDVLPSIPVAAASVAALQPQAPPALAVALAPAPAPAPDATKCATCHAALTAGKQEHAALKKEGCLGCHAPAPGQQGKCRSAAAAAWRLTTGQPDLCQRCHDSITASGEPHTVIKTRGCTACHDPHASTNPSLMKVWPVEKNCYGCHKRLDADKSVHTPVGKGECLGCHDAHSSEFAPLLVAEKKLLCLKCHEAVRLKHGKTTHTPFLENRCLECHDAHRAPFPEVLRESGKALCLGCHDSKATGPAKVQPALRIDLGRKDVHAPLNVGACQLCHSQQHGADNKFLLLTKTTPQTCAKCHKGFDGLAYPHGAVKTGRCSVCHDPHSADRADLLRADKQRAVCYLCHKDDLTGRRVIHKPILEKGCTACHDPHGADYPFDLPGGEGKDVCYKCHKPVDNVKNVHAALTRNGCTGCHDPHGSDTAGLLIKDVSTLCISCHEKQKSGDHVTKQATHKLSGGSDPKHKERGFSCISCHDPHGTDNPKLFYFGSSAQGMCIYCHGDRSKKTWRDKK